jgi:hypothetical protein
MAGSEVSSVRFSVRKTPDENAEELFAFRNNGELMFVHTVFGAGGANFSCQSKPECDEVEKSRRQLVVFERKGDWIKIKGADHPPQNGAFGWIKTAQALSAINPIVDPSIRKTLIRRNFIVDAGFISEGDRILANALGTKRQGKELWAYLEFGGKHWGQRTKWNKVAGWVPVYSLSGDLQIFFYVPD